jgi:hypothetical protein
MKLQVSYKDSKLFITLDGKEVPFINEVSKEISEKNGAFIVDINVDESDVSKTVAEVSTALNQHNLDTFMPYKGEGFFVIDDASKVDLAYKIIEEHVGDFEYSYCPENFVQVYPNYYEKYYGKFEIEDLDGLYKKMLDNGITVLIAKFNYPECD